MQESQHSYRFNFFTLMNSFAVNTQIHLLGLAATAFYRMMVTFSSSTLQTTNTCACPHPFSAIIYAVMNWCVTPHISMSAPWEYIEMLERNSWGIQNLYLASYFKVLETSLRKFLYKALRSAGTPQFLRNQWWHQRPSLFPRKELIILRLFFSVIHDFPIDLEHCHNLTNPPWTHSWF